MVPDPYVEIPVLKIMNLMVAAATNQAEQNV